MSENIAIGMELVGFARPSHLRISATRAWLRLLDAGKAVVRVLLVPIAFSLACAGLFIFGLIAKYSDQHQ
jgi:hypothetical protein